MKYLSSALGMAMLSLVVVGTALGLATGRLWLGELAVNVRWHIGIVAAAAVPLLALGGARWRAVVATAAAAYHLVPSIALAWAPAPELPMGQDLRVASVNLLADNRDTDDLDHWIAVESPDVVVLLEVSEFWREHIADTDAFNPYPYRVVEPRMGAFGIAVLSRLPIATHAVLEVGQPGIPYVEATVDHNGCAVRLLAVHTIPPVTPSMTSARNAIIDEVLTRLGGPVPTVLAGDLNATLYSPTFRRLLADGELVDTRLGVGRSPTWLPVFGPAGLDLDHVLLSGGMASRSRRSGPEFGSDHLPVAVDLVRADTACVPVGPPPAAAEGSGGVSPNPAAPVGIDRQAPATPDGSGGTESEAEP